MNARPAPHGDQAPAYWDAVAAQLGGDRQSATWRAYMQGAYRALMARAFAAAPDGRTCKTDLFEEAITPLHLFGDLGAQPVGVDVSTQVVATAAARLRRERGAPAAVAVADLRALPLADGVFARILSGSSLDHFRDKADIAVALGELVRCLQPGGCLVVTFDNPHNPLVRLRNGLPFPVLSAIGLVPYYVGATYSRDEAVRTLTALGLRVTDVRAIAHVPRAPAIWLSNLAARLGGNRVSARLLALFRAWDVMEGRFGQFRTGYYLAVRAEKPA